MNYQYFSIAFAIIVV